MNRYRVCTVVAVMFATTESLHAQAMLRAAPSSRATSEVSLAYPRPAVPMGAMPGMAPAPATTATPVAPAAVSPAMPAAKPQFIRLDYGQPHLRGRALHTDSLVPYDKPWRTGASGSTTLTTDVDLVIGGVALVKGTYVLYTIPGRAVWKLIIQRSVGQSAMQYADSNDVVRIDLRHTTLPTSFESFTMWLIPSLDPGPARGELRFAWGTDQLSTDWSVK